MAHELSIPSPVGGSSWSRKSFVDFFLDTYAVQSHVKLVSAFEGEQVVFFYEADFDLSCSTIRIWLENTLTATCQ